MRALKELTMRIDVVGKANLPVTEAMRHHAEGKAQKLPKFFDGVQHVIFRLSKADHSHTPEFSVELVVDVEKHEDFVSHATGEDLYAAIDQAVQKSIRQLTEFKERLKGQ
jgi:putative sigma-54 modulation protein